MKRRVWILCGGAGLLGLASVSGTASAAPTLSVVGECPGEVTLRATGLDAYATVTVMYGEAARPGTGLDIPRGPCAGVETELATGSRGFDLTDTDGTGMLSFTTVVSTDRCGTAFHLLDMETCEVSNLGAIPEPEVTTTTFSSSYYAYYYGDYYTSLYEYYYGDYYESLYVDYYGSSTTTTTTMTTTTTSPSSWMWDYYYGSYAY